MLARLAVLVVASSAAGAGARPGNRCCPAPPESSDRLSVLRQRQTSHARRGTGPRCARPDLAHGYVAQRPDRRTALGADADPGVSGSHGWSSGGGLRRRDRPGVAGSWHRRVTADAVLTNGRCLAPAPPTAATWPSVRTSGKPAVRSNGVSTFVPARRCRVARVRCGACGLSAGTGPGGCPGWPGRLTGRGMFRRSRCRPWRCCRAVRIDGVARALVRLR